MKLMSRTGLLTLLALTACGGGSDSGTPIGSPIGTAPTPVPTPVSSPTPAPASEFLTFDGPSPSVRWAVSLGAEDSDADEVDGIAIGPAGQVLATGVFRISLVVGDEAFRSAGEGDVFLASYAVDGAVNWARRFGGPGDENAFDLAVDAAGNIVISGWFSGTVDFGGVSLTSRGATDMMVAKYDAAGRLIWARSFGGAAGDGGNEIATTGAGEIAVAMIADGPTSIDGTAYQGGGGTRDSYLLRLGPDGSLRWVATFNGTGTERIRAVTMNEAGEVWAGFQYRGTLLAAGRQLPAAGDWDGAVVKIDARGAQQWVRPVAGVGEDNVRGLAASSMSAGSCRARATCSGDRWPRRGLAAMTTSPACRATAISSGSLPRRCRHFGRAGDSRRRTRGAPVDDAGRLGRASTRRRDAGDGRLICRAEHLCPCRLYP